MSIVDFRNILTERIRAGTNETTRAELNDGDTASGDTYSDSEGGACAFVTDALNGFLQGLYDALDSAPPGGWCGAGGTIYVDITYQGNGDGGYNIGGVACCAPLCSDSFWFDAVFIPDPGDCEPNTDGTIGERACGCGAVEDLLAAQTEAIVGQVAQDISTDGGQTRQAVDATRLEILGQVEALAQQLSDTAEGIFARFTQVDQEIDGVRDALSATEAALSALISGVGAQVSGVAGQVSGVAVQVDGVSAQVSGVSGQVASVQATANSTLTQATQANSNAALAAGNAQLAANIATQIRTVDFPQLAASIASDFAALRTDLPPLVVEEAIDKLKVSTRWVFFAVEATGNPVGRGISSLPEAFTYSYFGQFRVLYEETDPNGIGEFVWIRQRSQLVGPYPYQEGIFGEGFAVEGCTLSVSGPLIYNAEVLLELREEEP